MRDSSIPVVEVYLKLVFTLTDSQNDVKLRYGEKLVK
jgi:hypothetical protein